MMRKNRSHVSLAPLPVVLLVLAAAWPLGAQDAAADIGRHHVLALEAGTILPPFAFEDPYSAALGGGLLYEFHGLFPRFPIYFGASLSYHVFLPQVYAFGSSHMLQGGLYTGFPFSFGVPGKLVFSPSPYLGYKHYYRQHVFEGETSLTNRPVLVAGLDVRLARAWFLGGVRVEYNLLLEDSPLHAVAAQAYAGVSF
ncbi:MAG: hypothetical protein A2Y63_01250 [Candidatus Riflebacteria bacterium RBG_13_59_9]|nr:MAG: hypothetical protein A2Y63_01250 [Candidatus Riflebacteria bacterium RBG_13_59_9]